jgi:hypothetical protein
MPRLSRCARYRCGAESAPRCVGPGNARTHRVNAPSVGKLLVRGFGCAVTGTAGPSATQVCERSGREASRRLLGQCMTRSAPLSRDSRLATFAGRIVKSRPGGPPHGARRSRGCRAARPPRPRWRPLRARGPHPQRCLELAGHVGADHAWEDHRRQDAGPPELAPQCSGEPQHSVLRRRVGRAVRGGDHGCRGRQVDDVPAPARQEPLQRQLGACQDAAQVHLDLQRDVSR